MKSTRQCMAMISRIRKCRQGKGKVVACLVQSCKQHVLTVMDLGPWVWSGEFDCRSKLPQHFLAKNFCLDFM